MVRSAPEFPTSELRLVLLSACGPWADDEIRAVVSEDIDWSVVTAIASWELATSVLACRLEALGVDVLPASVAGLRRTGMVEEFRMAALEERARALVAAFDRAGVETMLLKGAGIAVGQPDGFRARPMGDVDLLVRPGQAARAHAIALESGWVERESALGQDAYRDMPHLRPMVAGDGLGFGLELHTRLFPTWSPFVFPVEGVWERAVSTDGWSGARVPAVEDQLLYACLHFAWSHAFTRGMWRVTRDAAILISDPRLDADTLVGRTREARGASAVYWTLRTLEELTGRDFAPEIVKPLRDAARPMFSRILLRHIVQEALPATEVPGTRTLRRLLWSAAIRPGAMGHGSARPWSGGQRWVPATGPGAAGGRSGALTDRLRGLCSYSLHLSGLG